MSIFRSLFCQRNTRKDTRIWLGHIDTFAYSVYSFHLKIGRSKLLFRYWHSDQLHNLAVQYEKQVTDCQKGIRHDSLYENVWPFTNANGFMTRKSTE
jgi:hypothetical protein